METERLLLRPLTIEDSAAIYEMAKDPDVGIHAGWPTHTSLENTQEIMREFLIADGTFGIVAKENNQVIGVIGLSTDRKRENEKVRMIGYWLGKPYWGKGYMSEAIPVMIAYGFDEINLSLISIYHYAGNARSKNVIQKAGFQYEGCLRKAAQRFDGETLDDVMYSMSKEEYQNM